MPEKKKFYLGISIFAVLVLLVGISCFMTIRQYVNASQWEAYDPMPQEKKELFANVSRMPELFGCFERYAVKGLRDLDCLIETRRYEGLDEMCEALPAGCGEAIEKALSEENAQPGEDIGGDSAVKYGVETGLPLVDRKDLNEKYKSSYVGAVIQYFVLKNPDGAWRFCVSVRDT